jgi:hypothetical protein
MNKKEKNIKKSVRIVKTIKETKKYTFDDGLIFLGTHLSY